MEPRLWEPGEFPPEYVTNGEDTQLFSVEFEYNGIFIGEGPTTNRSYTNIGCTHDAFDYCHVDTWSLGMAKYCLSRLDYDPIDPLVKVYWILPGKDIVDGFVCVDTEETIAAMITASKEAKTLDVIVDEKNKIRTLYGDHVILNRCPSLHRKLPRSGQFGEGTSGSYAEEAGEEEETWEGEDPGEEEEAGESGEAKDAETDSDFYECDFDCEDGDDDLFAENVDPELNDNNEKQAEVFEEEDPLDDDDLNLSKKELEKLNYKFRVPMRDRAHWQKMNGIRVHPPVFTKVMGRPPKNRKKTPEEKKKDGSVYLNKKGVTMHCSICGKSDHNKKGHDKYTAAEVEAQLDEEEEIEDPSILQDILPARLNPRFDPVNVRTSMVYMMGQEDRAYVREVTSPGPLPEQATFVLDAIDSIPQRTRTTTATNRGRVRARRKSRTTSEQTHPDEPGSSAQAGRQNKRKTTTSSTESGVGRGAGRGGTRAKGAGRGAGRGGTRARGATRGASNGAGREGAVNGVGREGAPIGAGIVESSSGGGIGGAWSGFGTGGFGNGAWNGAWNGAGIGGSWTGSDTDPSQNPLYRLMFGDDGARHMNPDHNARDEIPVSQNAPPGDQC